MEGKRVAPEKGGRKPRWLIPVVIAVLLAAAYIGLCFLGSREVLWPHTTLGGVDLSGLTPAQASEKLEQELADRWAESELTVTEADSGKTYLLNLNGLARLADPEAALDGAMAHGPESGAFLVRGFNYLKNFFSGGVFLAPELELTPDGEKAITDLLHRMNEELGETGGETAWVVEENVLTVTKGVTALGVDRAALESGVMAALKDPDVSVTEVSLMDQPPEAPDWQAIHDEVAVEPVDAQLDRETWKVVPSVTGVGFALDRAAEQFEQAAEGAEISVELIYTEPEVTTELLNKTLFRDTLGAAATKFTGSSARRQNIARACALINGMVLFPGDEFSYSKTCSPYSVANGYGYAGAYVDGKTVDSLAGGICQGSSTLYWAVLKSNLKVTERHPHIYEPAYIAGGLDATVYGSYGTGGLDFRFVNDTQAPIRITAYVDNSNFVRFSIQGTNTTGLTGQPYAANRTVKQYATTVYEPNANVPQGTTRRDYERTAYNAVSIEAYQQLVDVNGKVVSTQLLHRDNYRLRNAVVFYNPADAALWGIDPSTGLQTLTPVPATPAPTAAPVESPAVTPGPDTPPAITETPAPAETAAPSVTPTEAPAVPSEVPEETPVPPAPIMSEIPAVPTE